MNSVPSGSRSSSSKKKLDASAPSGATPASPATQTETHLLLSAIILAGFCSDPNTSMTQLQQKGVPASLRLASQLMNEYNRLKGK